MAEPILREYRPGDVPGLSLLWRAVFGDSLQFTAEFFARLPDMGSAVVAEKDGRIVGAASILDAMELVGKQKKPLPVGYLYGIMVAEDCRGLGLGQALTREAAALAERRGAALVCTLPASPSLYGFYHRVLGIECALHRKKRALGTAPLLPAEELSATEYQLWREQLLKGKRYLRPSHAVLEYQQRFCRFYGGGLYACGSGICAAVLEDGVCVIKELITRESADCDLIAASVGAKLGANLCEYYLPAREGEPYIAARPGSIPADCAWFFSFD